VRFFRAIAALANDRSVARANPPRTPHRLGGAPAPRQHFSRRMLGGRYDVSRAYVVSGCAEFLPAYNGSPNVFRRTRARRRRVLAGSPRTGRLARRRGAWSTRPHARRALAPHSPPMPARIAYAKLPPISPDPRHARSRSYRILFAAQGESPRFTKSGNPL
jgi:hypothetical protein